MTPTRRYAQQAAYWLRRDLEMISQWHRLAAEAVSLGDATQQDVDDLRRMGEGLAKILEDPAFEEFAAPAGPHGAKP